MLNTYTALLQWTGRTRPKSSSANSRTLPSKSLFASSLVLRSKFFHSLATETDYVRKTLVDEANDMLSLGVAGFRLDAAKRTFHRPISRRPIARLTTSHSNS